MSITLEDMVQRNTELLLDLQQDIKKLLNKDSNVPEELITGEDAAALFRMGYVHFMNFWKNKLPHQYVGRRVYFNRAAVLSLAQDRERKKSPVEYRQAAAV